MAGKASKAGGKRVMKYSRDGAVERDLLQQSETRISGRTEDAVLKTEAPADELFGKDHKPQEQAEQPKHHKPRFIDEQQDTGSKLQADYATHREETPLTFENTAPVPTTSVENTETTIPEKPMPLDDRSESAYQSDAILFLCKYFLAFTYSICYNINNKSAFEIIKEKLQ